MATNKIGEKIYHSDPLVKVTNVRITCNDISVPVGKIERVNIYPRIEAYCFAVSICLLSLFSFIFCQFLPLTARIAYAAVMVIAVTSSAFWVYRICKNYIELELFVGNQRIVILSAGMWKRMYVCRIASSLGEALLDEKKYQNMKESGELAESSTLSSTETMRLKVMLDDYESISLKVREQYERRMKQQRATA